MFVPCAFIPGIIGQFFRQFALTIAVSTVISAFNSLTLSPALAALLLKRREKGHFEPLPWFVYPPLGAWLGHKLGLYCAKPALAALHLGLKPELRDALRAVACPILRRRRSAALPLGVLLSRPINGFLGWSFRQFNRGFDASTAAYTRAVSGLLRVSAVVLLVYGGLLFLTWFGFTHTPTGFIPAQDKGYLLVNVQLPDAASVERTQAVVQKIEKIAHETQGRQEHASAISGQSILLNANAPNFGAIYLMLDDFDERRDADAVGRRDRRVACRQSCSRRRPRRRSTFSARRRWRAWARPAASRSSWRTAAATTGRRRCSPASDADKRRARRRPPTRG